MSAGSSAAAPAAASAEPPEYWPAEGAELLMEATLRKWSTPRQILELEKALDGQKAVVRDALCGRVLAAKLAMRTDRRAQLDGLASRPQLNGCEVELLGTAGIDGRVPVRVRSDRSEIRVSMARLLPARELRGANRRSERKRSEARHDANGLKRTELSQMLARRREELLDQAENLTLSAYHLSGHQTFINTQAERLQETAVAIRKRFAIVQGLYKTTKAADRILQLQAREETIRAQEAAYNANVEWLRLEQAWLNEQPAMVEAMAKVREMMVQGPDGKWVEKAYKAEPEEALEEISDVSFDELLAQMKLEEAGGAT
jgi:hypothetical protein